MNYNFRQSGHLGMLVYYDKMTADMKDEFEKALMASFWIRCYNIKGQGTT